MGFIKSWQMRDAIKKDRSVSIITLGLGALGEPTKETVLWTI
jgi:hypothetical protein